MHLLQSLMHFPKILKRRHVGIDRTYDAYVRNVHMALCFPLLFGKRICFPRPSAAHEDALLAPYELPVGKCICSKNT